MEYLQGANMSMQMHQRNYILQHRALIRPLPHEVGSVLSCSMLQLVQDDSKAADISSSRSMSYLFVWLFVCVCSFVFFHKPGQTTFNN